MSTAQSHRGGLASVPAVAELQGLYGPFTFPEKLLQKIWFRGDFDQSRATVSDQRIVVISHGGRWNLLGGPDFKGARLRFGADAEITGDVELHLHASDWDAHGHAADPAYDGVVLHVVLFTPPVGHITRGVGGREIPVLSLLSLLHHDLEEYAAEEAVETLANRPAAQIVERLGPLPPDELATLVASHAQARWRQKVHFAKLRVRRLGWDEACHQTAMEILGYRFNRATMLRVATAHPLREWANGALSVDAIFASEKSSWSLHGLRPANHPRLRLHQYQRWLTERPDWPERLAELRPSPPRIEGDLLTGAARQNHSFVALRGEWAIAICAEAIGGTRWDTLVCDGLLPLIAARAEQPDGLQQVWYHWYAGDLPPLLPRALRQLQIFAGRARPACHGAAQGLLGWLIECERTTVAVNESAPQGRSA